MCRRATSADGQSNAPPNGITRQRVRCTAEQDQETTGQMPGRAESADDRPDMPPSGISGTPVRCASAGHRPASTRPDPARPGPAQSGPVRSGPTGSPLPLPPGAHSPANRECRDPRAGPRSDPRAGPRATALTSVSSDRPPRGPTGRPAWRSRRPSARCPRRPRSAPATSRAWCPGSGRPGRRSARCARTPRPAPAVPR